MNKVTPLGLEMLLATHLSGICFFEDVLMNVNFSKDSEGNVHEHVVDNLKLTLRVLTKTLHVQSPDSHLIRKYKSVLKELLPYGTEVVSSQTQQFLSLLEKNPEMIEEVGENLPIEFCLEASNETAVRCLQAIPLFESSINNTIQSHPDEAILN